MTKGVKSWETFTCDFHVKRAKQKSIKYTIICECFIDRKAEDDYNVKD